MHDESDARHSFHITPKSFLVLIGLGFLAYGIWYIRGTLLVVLSSVVLATFVYAGVQSLARFKIPRPFAVVILYAVGLFLIVGALYLFVPIFLDEFIGLIDLFPPDSDIANIMGSLGDGKMKELMTNLSGTNPIEAVNYIRAQFATNGFIQSLSVVFGGVLNFVLIIVISFYLSMREHGVEQFLRIITPIQYELYVLDVWRRSQIKIASWFRGQLLLAIIHALSTYIGLVIIGVPYAFLLSLVTLLLSLVPFGIIFATLPAGVFAFLSGGMPMLLVTLGLYFVLEQIETYILQPLIIRRMTGVPSVIVLISLIIGAQIAGILGMLLAVPVAVVILEIVSDAEQKRVDALLDS